MPYELHYCASCDEPVYVMPVIVDGIEIPFFYDLDQDLTDFCQTCGALFCDWIDVRKKPAHEPLWDEIEAALDQPDFWNDPRDVYSDLELTPDLAVTDGIITTHDPLPVVATGPAHPGAIPSSDHLRLTAKEHQAYVQSMA